MGGWVGRKREGEGRQTGRQTTGQTDRRSGRQRENKRCGKIGVGANSVRECVKPAV